jgi:hypothetical protein
MNVPRGVRQIHFSAGDRPTENAFSLFRTCDIAAPNTTGARTERAAPATVAPNTAPALAHHRPGKRTRARPLMNPLTITTARRCLLRHFRQGRELFSNSMRAATICVCARITLVLAEARFMKAFRAAAPAHRGYVANSNPATSAAWRQATRTEPQDPGTAQWRCRLPSHAASD